MFLHLSVILFIGGVSQHVMGQRGCAFQHATVQGNIYVTRRGEYSPQPINMWVVSILMECFLVNFAFVQCKWEFKLITSLNRKPDFHIKLECIPVGCILPTAVAVMKGLYTPPWEHTTPPPPSRHPLEQTGLEIPPPLGSRLPGSRHTPLE